MMSVIVTATEQAERTKKIAELQHEYHIDPFDVTIIQRDLNAKPVVQSLGIDIIKGMKKKLYLKPLRSKTKLVVIEEAHLLTPEAQNSLLKVLEEPPDNTVIVLSVDNEENLLPTIRSRCQIIKLQAMPRKLKDKEREELQLFINQLPTMSIGEKLKYAEKLAKDKEKALIRFEKLMLILRDNMLLFYRGDEKSTPPEDYVMLLHAFQDLRSELKNTNVNPRFAIEHTLLTL